jgi:hypothetical protein
MAVGFPTKVTYANGDVFSAGDINDTNGTINLINPSAKGDIFAGSAANTYTKLSVGGNTAPLVADSTTSTGLRWDNSAWTVYIPTWTSSGTAPTIGNGVITGAYKQRGKVITGYATLVVGSTSTVGTGTYYLSLPVNAKNASFLGIISGGWLVDASAGTFYSINADTSDGASKLVLRNFIASGTYTTIDTVRGGTPMTWAVNDVVYITFEYEVA